MTKMFKLDPDPTFDLDIPIPVPGNGFPKVRFTCRYRDMDGYESLMNDIDKKSHTEVVFLIATGWNLDVEFNEENVTKLVRNYMGATAAILEAYAKELMKVREKN